MNEDKFNITNRIVAWNLKRNNLAWNFELEKSMLMEEVREFLEAKTLANRLKEFADIAFVFIGTKAKAEKSGEGSLAYDDLINWVDASLVVFGKTIVDTLIELFGEDADLDEFADQVMNLVVSANEAKGTEKDENGKVIKGANYVKPEPEIEKLIAQYTKGGNC